MSAFTPGPWWVRTLERDGEIVSCFVAAKDVQGMAYDAEILGDDEYRDGIERNLADAHLVAAAPNLYEAATHILAILDHETRSVTALDADRLRKAIAKAEGKA